MINIRRRYRQGDDRVPSLFGSDSSPANMAMSGAMQQIPNHLQVEMIGLELLRAPSRQLRRQAERKLVKLMASMKRFGFIVPILITPGHELITGVARVEAARRLNLKHVPAISIHGLSEAEIRAFRIADNRLVELGEWDEENLALELRELSTLDLDFSLELTGFETAEIDLRIDGLSEGKDGADPADAHPPLPAMPTSRTGDVWLLGDHRLVCGNALVDEAYAAVMQGELARLVMTDPPYNVEIDGHVGGLGRHHHRPFAMATGEMTEEQFTAFLEGVLRQSRRNLMPDGLALCFMDWRHVHEITTAQRRTDLDLINVCCWVKTNGGMGSLYRSRHELAFLFGDRRAGYANNVQLGRFGRYRTNVWEYAGVNAFGKTRDQDLSDHPTVKPVALVADAIRDVTLRGEVVLDPFVGSGTTILAAERTGRRARAIEIDPVYVDVAIRRWCDLTGKTALLETTGQSFDEVAAQRSTKDQLFSVRDTDAHSFIRRRSRSQPVIVPVEG
jgi:DNA modification methylase